MRVIPWEGLQRARGPQARMTLAGGWFISSPSITVDHRPKLLLEGFPVGAWIGPVGREGLNPGLQGPEEAAFTSYFQQPRWRQGCSAMNPFF